MSGLGLLETVVIDSLMTVSDDGQRADIVVVEQDLDLDLLPCIHVASVISIRVIDDGRVQGCCSDLVSAGAIAKLKGLDFWSGHLGFWLGGVVHFYL